MKWKQIKTKADLPKDHELYWVTHISPFGGNYVYIAYYAERWVTQTGVEIENVIAYMPYCIPKPYINKNHGLRSI